LNLQLFLLCFTDFDADDFDYLLLPLLDFEESTLIGFEFSFAEEALVDDDDFDEEDDDFDEEDDDFDEEEDELELDTLNFYWEEPTFLD
jgi:hypothetical protein